MKFNMNRAWSGAMAMIRGNREVLAIMAGLLFFLPVTVFSLFMPAAPSLANLNEGNAEQWEAAMNAYLAQNWPAMVVLVVVILIGWLALMALLRHDSKPTVGEAIATGLKSAPTMIGAVLVFNIATSIALTIFTTIGAAVGLAALFSLIGLVVLIALDVRISLLSPVITLDGERNPLKALGRSWKLTKGNGWRLFAFFALMAIVYFVLAAIASMFLSVLLMLTGDAAGPILASALGGIISSIVLIIMVAVVVAIHRQLAEAEPVSLPTTTK